MAFLTLDTIIEKTQAIVQETILPQAQATDHLGQWPVNNIRALQAAGLGGLVVPLDCEGLGQGYFALVRVCEEIGQACPSTALCFGMHHVASAVIAAKATSEQKQRFLLPISRGEHLTTLALSEPGTGMHFYFPQTSLQVHDTQYEISGTKSFITNGGHADSYVISTLSADPEAPVDAFSCVLLPKDTPGMAWQRDWDGLGMRGNSSRHLVLEQVRLPQENLLGAEGDQIWYVFHVVAPYFLVAMAGTYLGVAQAALEEAQRHLVQRKHSHNGQTLAQQPVLQHRLGCLWSQVERTRQLVYYAAQSLDSEATHALPAIMSAKAEVADCAVAVVNEVMTLLGGQAYLGHHRLHQMLRDARAAHIMAPTTDILRIWTGRFLLGLPLLGE